MCLQRNRAGPVNAKGIAACRLRTGAGMDSTSIDFDAPAPLLPELRRTAISGMAALTDVELLTLVMSGVSRPSRTGRPQKLPPTSRARAAERLLRAAGSLRRLARWSLPEMSCVAGIGDARAAPLLAAIELGRRTALERVEPGAPLGSPSEIHRHYRAVLRDERREIFLAALLDTRLRLIRDVRISEGSLNAAVVHPREAFAPAVREPAFAIAFVHNHPSGDSSPSDEDRALTKRLVACGDVLGIKVVDHIVIGEDEWFSFAEAGALKGA